MLYTMYTFVSLSVTRVFMTTVQHAGMRFGVKLWASVFTTKPSDSYYKHSKSVNSDSWFGSPLAPCLLQPYGQDLMKDASQ